MIGAVIAKLGLPALLDVAGGVLSKIDHPLAQNAAKALLAAENALTSGDISPEAVKEANRHIERLAELESAERTQVLGEVNQSLRSEVTSTDAYVRRMRPTFGYLMAFTWTVQMLALSYVLVFDTGQAGVVFSAVESLSAIWTVALSVLGIYVYKRSEEKRQQPVASPAAAAVVTPVRKPVAGSKMHFND